MKRDEAARELAYAQRGIGLDESCHLQMVIDHLCRTREDLMDIYRDYPAGSINTVKVCRDIDRDITLVRSGLKNFQLYHRLLPSAKQFKELNGIYKLVAQKIRLKQQILLSQILQLELVPINYLEGDSFLPNIPVNTIV